MIFKKFKSKYYQLFKGALNGVFQNDLDLVKQSVSKHVVIICSPKSGSTWLSRSLQEITNFKRLDLISSFERREQEIDVYHLLHQKPAGEILSPHIHLKYSEFSENIFKSINSKVILQVRNIFDSIISLVDHIDNEGVKFPSAFIDNESWFNFSRLEKIEFIIDMAIPWYISFYAGWFNSDIFKSGSVYLITYEKLVNNTSQEIKSILDWAGIKKNEGEIAQGLENTSKSNTRKNVGRLGRGSEIPASLKEKVIKMASYHSNVDFRPLGIVLD